MSHGRSEQRRGLNGGALAQWRAVAVELVWKRISNPIEFE
jgi:hypothetical protein